MKGFYLFAPVEPGCVGPGSGIERKVRAQHKALSQHLDCELVILPPVEYTGSIREKIARRLPLTAAWRKWEYRGEFDGADFLYIRQVYHDASFARYLRAIRKRNPNIKIIYEVPTYPFLTEQKSTAANAAFRKKEARWSARAAKYFDRIVTYYGQNEIWGVPCLKLINGFDFSQVQVPHRSVSDEIHILSVAVTAFWHGYDRLIEGLGRYYADGGQEQIVYHLVGDRLPAHADLVRRWGIEDHVAFHGRMTPEQMQPIYTQCLMAVDVLGGHRKNYPVSSSLKSREYAAYGLPILTASPVDYLPRDVRYQMLAPYDDSPVDIRALLDFYHGIYDGADPDRIAAEIRSYAESRCDMTVTMKPAADYLSACSRISKEND